MTETLPPPQFLFVTCQVGAETAVKNELKRDWPDFRFAYSRPGFLTFKLPPGILLADDFDLRSVFARASGLTIGKITGASLDERTALLVTAAGKTKYDHVHVFTRDAVQVGHRGFEPGPNEAAIDAHRAITTALSKAADDSATPHSELHTPNSTPRRGDLILDCILVEADTWWLGYHRVSAIPSRWPGGIFTIEPPPDMVSRAYIKMREALAWSRLPIKRGDTVTEIGAAPGGASQAFLEKGLKVIGIDPAAMDDRIAAHPKFTHIRKRGHEVRRREFRGVRWLTADINVAPQYTLDAVEAIVTHRDVNIGGLLLTLKLLDWKLADEVPAYLDRVRSWGYRHVAARQLSHNRQEVCLKAIRTPDEPPKRRDAKKR
jgi:23S rRNA (cytidine2498-2'-O)-methyltransferase